MQLSGEHIQKRLDVLERLMRANEDLNSKFYNLWVEKVLCMIKDKKYARAYSQLGIIYSSMKYKLTLKGNVLDFYYTMYGDTFIKITQDGHGTVLNMMTNEVR